MGFMAGNATGNCLGERIDTKIRMKYRCTRCGRGILSVRCGNASADILLAATAMEHDCTVVTRNVRHFEPAGVHTYNPWT